MKIGIIGLGIVGSAVDYGLRMLGHKTYPHDIKLNTTVNDVIDTEICYICIPTPESATGPGQVTDGHVRIHNSKTVTRTKPATAQTYLQGAVSGNINPQMNSPA